MGCRVGDSPSEQLSITSPPSSPPSNDEAAFLYAIFCLIGLPVDVRVRNGSVLSGIFHTASAEGVVLKKARLTKKGKSDTNVAVGCTIETLIIFSGDLVQVVAKGEVVSASVIGGNSDNDEFGSAWGTVAASCIAGRVGKNLKGFTINKNNPFHKSASAVQTDDRLVNGINGISTRHIKDSAHSIQKEDMKTYLNAVGANFPEEMKTDQMILDEEASSIPQIERCEKLMGVMKLFASVGGGLAHLNAASSLYFCKNVVLTNTVVDSLPVGQTYRQGMFKMAKYKGKMSVAVENLISIACSNANSSAGDDSRLVNVKPVKSMNSAGQSQPHGGNHETTAGIHSNKGTCDRTISSDGATNSTTSALSSAPSLDTSFGLRSTTSPIDKFHFQPIEVNKIAKGSKLNPGAKIFSPSYVPTLATSPPLVQDAGGIAYIPGSSPLLPDANVQMDVGMGTFLPQNSLATKVFPYNDLTSGIGDSNPLSHPMVSSIGSRTPLLRYGGQQQAMHTGSSAYINPNSQAVIGGQLGQLVYMPVSQDLVQSAAAVSPVFAHPLPAVNQMQFPKHQGTAAPQAFAHPTVVAGQLYAAPNPTVLQSPFLAGRPISVAGSNGFYNAKFS